MLQLIQTFILKCNALNLQPKPGSKPYSDFEKTSILVPNKKNIGSAGPSQSPGQSRRITRRGRRGAQVEDGQLINVSNVYRLAPGDTLGAVAQRFGLGLGGTLSLNPDLDNSGLPALAAGSAVCVLPRPAAYSRCAVAAEPANPAFFERVEGFDAGGVPIKAYNPRYPGEPRPPSANGL